MLSSILYISPEILLFLGIFNLLILRILKEESPKKYATVSRIWLILSMLFSIIFYDKSYSNLYFQNNAYTLVFKLLIGAFCYLMLGVSSLWFSSENRTGCRYYVLILISVILMNTLISSINISSLYASYLLLILTNYRLLTTNYDKIPQGIASRYIFVSGLIISIFSVGYYILYKELGMNTLFSSVNELYSNPENKGNIELFISAIAIIIPFLYSIGVVPFHIISEEKSGKSILPVAHYFSVILPLIYWATFIKLNIVVLSSYSYAISSAYITFAIISLFFGAIGANSRINLHRIFAYSSIFHYGLILMLIALFQKNAYFSGVIYLLAYIINLNGIYLMFYSLKSHGEYLSSTVSLSGLAQTRPYATNILLISLFSFIGFPPLVGFLGQFNLISELVNIKAYISIGIIFLCFIFLARAYFELIKIAYFEPKIKNYDTENKSLLVCILLNIVLIMIITFNPYGLITTIQDMFNVIFAPTIR